MSLEDEYGQNGFIVLRGVFSAQAIEAMRAECDALLAGPYTHADNIRSRFQKDSGVIPERIDPLTDISTLFNRIAHNPTLRDPVNRLLGGDAVLFKDKLIVKSPGTQGYAMHQDYAWWYRFGIGAADMLSAFIAIDDCSVRSGALEVYKTPGHGLICRDCDLNAQEEDELLQSCPGGPVEMKAGDVLLFSALAPHRSGINLSQNSRRALIFSYARAQNKTIRQDYYNYYIRRESDCGPQRKFW